MGLVLTCSSRHSLSSKALHMHNSLSLSLSLFCCLPVFSSLFKRNSSFFFALFSLLSHNLPGFLCNQKSLDSCWQAGIMGLLSNRIDREELQPADHIYSWRAAYAYAHHGIYVGNNKVIHFTRGQGQELGTGTFLDQFFASTRPPLSFQSCDVCGHHEENVGVVLSCLDCFLRDGPLYRFEYGVDSTTFLAKVRGGTCTLAKSDPPEEVLHRAHYLLQNGFGNYHIYRNNCEDFAMYCKTELLLIDGQALGRSGQAVSMLVGAPFAAVLSSPLGLAVTAGMYCLSRYAGDLGVREDVAKVPVEDLAINLGWSRSEATSE